jgi:hypothetical protein
MAANIDVLTHAVSKIGCTVILARRVRDSRVVGEFIDFGWVATVACSSCLAVDQDLRVEVDWRGGVEILSDVESVGKSRRRGLSPTGTTVLRDGFIFCPAEVVLTVHVSPVY